MGGLLDTAGSMLGIGDSPASKGMNWSPTGAPLSMPVTSEQATDAYNQSQTGIANQAAFLAALQAQSGIQNQSDAYKQMQGVANGTGPNPAQAMLAQATGSNVANQAALMAGQRGAGSNIGLMARQAAQTGAGIQQNAAGQAATMQANQSLSALNNLSGIAGQQVGQEAAATGALTGAQQSEQQLLLNSLAQQNDASVKNAKSLNEINSGQAQSGAKAQAGVIQGAMGMIGLAKGGSVPHYAGGAYVPVGPAVPVTSAPIDQSRQPLQFAEDKQPAGAPMGPSAPPSPKAPTKFAKSVSVMGDSQDPNKQSDPFNQEGQAVGKGIGAGLKGLASGIQGLFGSGSDGAAPADSQPGDMSSSMMDNLGVEAGGAAGGMEFARGGPVKAMVSPGERYLSPSEVDKVAKGKKAPEKAGEKIHGKAKVNGDSLRNDVVPKTLQEGGIVLPRSVTGSKNPHEAAHKFVSAILAKQGFPKKR